MYPRIPWEPVANPLGSAEHSFDTAVLNDFEIKMFYHLNYVLASLQFLWNYSMHCMGEGAVHSGIALQAGKYRVRFPMVS